MPKNIKPQSNLLPTTYNQQVLQYGKEMFLLMLGQSTTGLFPYERTSFVSPFSFFEDIFPLFEKEAHKFYSLQDPDMELLQLFFQSITQCADFKSIHKISAANNEKKDLFLGLFKVVIAQANVNTVAYSQLPLFEKLLIEKNLPSESAKDNSTSAVHKI